MPFELRLLKGMNPPVPEVTVLIHRITKDRWADEYRLHIKRVLNSCLSDRVGFCLWLAGDEARLRRRPSPREPRCSCSRRLLRPAVARSRSRRATAAVWIALRG